MMNLWCRSSHAVVFAWPGPDSILLTEACRSTERVHIIHDGLLSTVSIGGVCLAILRPNGLLDLRY